MQSSQEGENFLLSLLFLFPKFAVVHYILWMSLRQMSFVSPASSGAFIRCVWLKTSVKSLKVMFLRHDFVQRLKQIVCKKDFHVNICAAFIVKRIVLERCLNQLVKQPALDFSSHPDLTVLESSPMSMLSRSMLPLPLPFPS